MKKIMLAKLGAEFYIGTCNDGDDKLENCLVFIFNQIPQEDSNEPQIVTNLSNPIPFTLIKKGTNSPYRPTMKIDHFDFVIDLNSDVEIPKDMIEFYLQCLVDEDSTYSGNLNSDDTNKEEQLN